MAAYEVPRDAITSDPLEGLVEIDSGDEYSERRQEFREYYPWGELPDTRDGRRKDFSYTNPLEGERWACSICGELKLGPMLQKGKDRSGNDKRICLTCWPSQHVFRCKRCGVFEDKGKQSKWEWSWGILNWQRYSVICPDCVASMYAEERRWRERNEEELEEVFQQGFGEGIEDFEGFFERFSDWWISEQFFMSDLRVRFLMALKGRKDVNRGSYAGTALSGKD